MRQLLALSLLVCVSLADAPYMATGVKVGEVTETSAIIWTRLTKDEHRVGPDAPIPIVKYREPKTGAIANEGNSRDRVPIVEFPNGASVDQLEGAAPGTPGEVRVDWVMEVSGSIKSSEWVAVDPNRDYTHQFVIKNLKPGAGYLYRVWARAKEGEPETMPAFGAFRTAYASDQPWPVTFTVTTGQEYNDKDSPNGFHMYEGMRKVSPSFFVHTGDILYYDALAKSLPLARWHWQRMYSLQTNVDFHKDIASYFIKDDHDTWMNDCWPTMKSPYMGEFTFAQGQAVFLEQVPMSEKTYRTFRWGKDLQIWLVEGRDFRSANDLPDGPEKTIWGKEQKEWFKRTVAESDASFRVLISPTPIVGPDRSSKNDNHANAGFKHEGEELRAFMAAQKNMVVVCGDRHWQYVSVDPTTGLREYSCGPASDAHAGGWPKDDKRPEHKYLNVIGGFLAVTVDRENEKPVLTARHYTVDGELVNEDRFGSEK